MNEGWRDDYDWHEAFGYAGHPGQCGSGEAAVIAGRPSTGESRAVTIGDVAEALAMVDGENDGPEWIGVFRLNDGAFLYLAAGCDYTGWDCQAGGYAYVSASLRDLWQWGVPTEDRGRLTEAGFDVGLLG